jgi:CheY-like chemotaxis protein
VTVDAAERALERLDAGGAPDLVLADQQLPDMSGLEPPGELEKRLSDLARILHTSDDELAAELAAGEIAAVVKPAAPDVLRREVGRMLSHRHQVPAPW